MSKISRKKRPLILFLAVLFAVAAVLAGAKWFSRPAAQGTQEIRQVVLISIDTCRADYLSCYGQALRTTPNIDEMASEAVTFTKVYSPVPLTLPAHSSMLTGTIPPFHGVHSNRSSKLGLSNLTLAEILRDNGFKTAAVISSFVLDSRFGLDQGFDTYNDTFDNPIPGRYKNERRAEETTRFACQWLDAHKDQKFFLFVHYYDPHQEYHPPEPFATTFKDDLYAGEIAYTDHCIGLMLDRLRQLHLYHSTLIIVTGDHGEMLGEHAEDTHGYFIYQSALKVPLIVKLPGKNKPRKIAEPVGLIDIFPTVLGRLNITPPPNLQGQDLSPWLQGKPPSQTERFIYCESLLPTTFNRSSLRGVVAEPWKYIQAPRRELYNIAEDPGEKKNLAKAQSQRVRILDNRLRHILAGSARSDTPQQNAFKPDSKSLARLKSLGYVGGGHDINTSQFDESKPDPKDFPPNRKNLAGDDTFLFIADMFADKHQELAAKMASEGKFAKAVEQYKAALRFRPQWPKVLNELAGILATTEDPNIYDPNEAITLAYKACTLATMEDPMYLETLAAAYAATGQFEKAAENARKAVDLAVASDRAELAKRIRNQLQSYQNKQPYPKNQ